MSTKKYTCPDCKVSSSELMWIEQTAHNLGVQYRNVTALSRASGSSSYVCPNCHKDVHKSRMVEVSNSEKIVANAMKKIYPTIIKDIKEGIGAIGVSLKPNKGETVQNYIFNFEKAHNIVSKFDSNGNLSLTTFKIGKVWLPEVKLKDGTKNTAHQDANVVGGIDLEVSYSYASDRANYILKNKDDKPVFNLADSINNYMEKVAKVQGVTIEKLKATGMFTKDDRYVEHCSDCPERYRCSSAELRPEYRAVRR